MRYQLTVFWSVYRTPMAPTENLLFSTLTFLSLESWHHGDSIHKLEIFSVVWNGQRANMAASHCCWKAADVSEQHMERRHAGFGCTKELNCCSVHFGSIVVKHFHSHDVLCTFVWVTRPHFFNCMKHVHMERHDVLNVVFYSLFLLLCEI